MCITWFWAIIIFQSYIISSTGKFLNFLVKFISIHYWNFKYFMLYFPCDKIQNCYEHFENIFYKKKKIKLNIFLFNNCTEQIAINYETIK